MRRALISRAVGYMGLVRHARKLRRDTDKAIRESSRLHVVARLGKLRGLPQKLGQMASTRIERDESAAYEQLTDSSEPLPWRRIKRTLQQTWGCRVEQHLRWIDPHGFGASLGQVHKAILHDGREVAIKIRYPGIRQAVMNDLKVLGWIAGQALGMPKDADFSDYRAEILRNLEEELDYRIEAEHQRRYRALAADVPQWVIPEIVDDLSNEEVLTSVWATGERIGAAVAWPPPLRQQIADALVQGFAHMLFHHGVLHADPHPGNYRFVQSADGPSVILYDFGSVTTITPRRRVALLKVLAVATSRSGDPYPALVELGFNESTLQPVRDQLPTICWTLFEPVWQPGKQRFEWGRSAQQTASSAGDGVMSLWMGIPAHLLFILRAFNGLRCYVDRLAAQVDWSTALAPCFAEHQAALAR